MKKVCFIAVLLGAVLTACNEENSNSHSLVTKGIAIPDRNYVIDEEMPMFGEDDLSVHLQEILQASGVSRDVNGADVTPIDSRYLMPYVDVFLKSMIGCNWYMDTVFHLPEALYYIYNFGEGGYAIMNADKSKPQTLLYFSPEGYFAPELFTAIPDICIMYDLEDHPENMFMCLPKEYGPGIEHDIFDVLDMSWFERWGLDRLADEMVTTMAIKLSIATCLTMREMEIVGPACNPQTTTYIMDDVLYWHEGEPYNQFCICEATGEPVNTGNMPITIALACAYSDAMFEYFDEYWEWPLIKADGDIERIAWFIYLVREKLNDPQYMPEMWPPLFAELGFIVSPWMPTEDIVEHFKEHREIPLLYHDGFGNFMMVTGYVDKRDGDCTHSFVLRCISSEATENGDNGGREEPYLIGWTPVEDAVRRAGDVYEFEWIYY